MAKSRPSVQKRIAEANKIEKKQAKAARKAARDAARAAKSELEFEGDPDLAGIVAGPQPVPEEFADDEDE